MTDYNAWPSVLVQRKVSIMTPSIDITKATTRNGRN